MDVKLRRLQVFLHRLKNDVFMFGILLAHSNCKMLLRECTDSHPNLILTGEIVGQTGCLAPWQVVSHLMVVYWMKCSLSAFLNFGTSVLSVRRSIIDRQSIVECNHKVCPAASLISMVFTDRIYPRALGI